MGGIAACRRGWRYPRDELDALAYASTFPFRPEAQGIVIIVTDAPDHHAGDGSASTAAHDQGFWDRRPYPIRTRTSPT